MRTMMISAAGLAAVIAAGCGGPADADSAAQTEAPAQSSQSQVAQATQTGQMSDSMKSEPADAMDEAEPVDLTVAKSGVYTPDPKHHHILFNYEHQGMSTSWVRWRDWTGELNWNAEAPEDSTVSITINATEPDSGVDVFDGHLRGEKFFDAAKYPEITFKSTSLDRSGPNSGTLTGDLTIKGVTKPVTLDVTLNNTAHNEEQDSYKIGFSAEGVVSRSEYGLDAYVPFVADDVHLVIETEWEMAGAAQ